MGSVALVIDSTAYLPSEIVAQYGISVIPLYVRFGDEVYRDNVDMKPDQFYSRLRNTPVMPATSQPSAGDFLELYRRLVEQGASAILSIHISGKLSGTVASALMAQQDLPDVPIYVIDSLSTAMGLGFMAIAAARALAAGRPVEGVVGMLESVRDKVRIIFVVDTLEFLHRGGRIGGAAAFLGSVLNLKPLLALRDGRIEAVERVRTKKRAVTRMLDMLTAEIDRQPVHVAVLHSAALLEGMELQRETQARLDCRELFLAELSPVIGTHTGPGTVGLVTFPVSEE